MSLDNSKQEKIEIFALPLGENRGNTGCYALGMIQAFSMFADNGQLQNYFLFNKISSYDSKDVLELIENIKKYNRPAIYLFSSFVWTHPINTKVAKFIKQHNPASLTVFGGPEIPKRKDDAIQFMRKYPEIDVAVMGEGEVTFNEMLKVLAGNNSHAEPAKFDFSQLTGLVCRKDDDEIFWSGMRDQIRDLDTIPSPFLKDVFSESVYSEWCVLETNRGCPFGCTYCDWGGATLSKVRKFNLNRVKKELEHLAKHEVQRLFIADANFGMLTRDMEIADTLIENRKRYGYPKIFNVNYAKNATVRVAHIVKKLYEHDIIDKAVISFQTLDQQTLDNVDRGNIKTKNFIELMEIYKSTGIPITTELLIGMPGQTLDTLAADINFLFEHMVIPQVYLTQVLTNAPMADPEYLKRFDIGFDQSNYITSSSSFTEADLQKMIYLNLAHTVLIQESFIKYICYHLQAEYDIKVISILLKMIELTYQKQPKYYWLYEFMSRMLQFKDDNIGLYLHPQWKKDQSKLVLDNLDGFYDDLYNLIEDEFNVSISKDEKSSLIALQLSLMEKPHRKLPDTKIVPHDVIKYFSQFKNYVKLNDFDEKFIKLKDFPKGKVHTPKQFIKKFPYNYSRSPARFVPEWPLIVEGLALQPNTFYDEELPIHYKHTNLP